MSKKAKAKAKKLDAVYYLDAYANHFSERDWNYTRKTDIKDIRYTGERLDPLSKRLTSGFHFLFRSKKHGIIYDNGFWLRIRMFFYSLERYKNAPDGHLDSGKILVLWEEDGEYLQMVQPTVGALLANFLKEDPEHPHAKIIIAELDRILAGYSERIDRGEVS